MATLIFIDTNIWLDFYRVRGKQGSLAILERIDTNREHIVSGVQVEMEFKKNRQTVILESHRSLKPPDLSGLQLPAFLAQSKQSSGLETGAKNIKRQIAALRDRTERIFADPTRNDPVYKTAQRLFRYEGPYNLHAAHEDCGLVRRRAYRRFILGYPPRKSGDTSVGDAVNWEWIVECAIRSGRDIVIVSRDSDFGVTFEGKPHFSDWLAQEFKERVSRKRSITLTDRLAEGFKRAAIPVPRAEVEAEEQFLRDRRPVPGVGSFRLTPATLTAVTGVGQALRAGEFNTDAVRQAFEVWRQLFQPEAGKGEEDK